MPTLLGWNIFQYWLYGAIKAIGSLPRSDVQEKMKTVHFHIGPHKTGSTAIQNVIRDYSEILEQKYNLFPMDDPVIGEITKFLRKGDKISATGGLNQLADLCRSRQGDCLVSSEDFCGELPGRSRRRKPYPKLFENLNTISKTFPDIKCKFYFFVRTPAEWLRSSYAQIIKYPTRFSSMEEYVEFLHTTDLWDETLRKSREKLNADFIEIRYEENADYSSVNALLRTILGYEKNLEIPNANRRHNRSPSAEIVPILEVINRSGASSDAQQLAKRWLQNCEVVPLTDASELKFPQWPAKAKKPGWLSPKLDELWERASTRGHYQEQPNILPDPFCDLSKFRTQLVDAPEEFPKGGRADMKNQERILRYRFRGLPETCYFLGLTISYLRRDTAYTEHAAYLFQRLWNEEYAVLLGSLPTRWLISTFQTFLDHGVNENQRRIGAAGYFLSNILKAYEAERALDGLQPDRIYPSVTPTTKSGYVGMDRFKLGGTDLLLNTNALLLELASQDDRAGRVVQEFMLRTMAANSVFSRMDQSRIKHSIDNPQFSNCWSFFKDPRQHS